MDSHADDIIQIVREEFGEGNEFCKKVTYQAKEDPKSVLAQFRNDYHPRIAVTVDMIATGTDVKPLECLLFMRNVKSRNYFEQMKGRGTRTLSHDDLRRVTPSTTSAKTHFVILEATGVTKSLKTDSRPLERKSTIPLKDLFYSVMMGSQDDDTVISLANRLARLSQQLMPEEQKAITDKTGGVLLTRIVHALLDAVNPDGIDAKARDQHGIPAHLEPTETQQGHAKNTLLSDATQMITGELYDLIEGTHPDHEQTIDTVNIDQVTFAGWDGQAKENAEKLTQDFSQYVKDHKDAIIALSIFYDQPHRRRELSYDMICEVLNKLKSDQPKLTPVRVWQAYAHLDDFKGKAPQNDLTALVSLIRRVCGIDASVLPYDDTVRRNFQSWILKRHQGSAPKFNHEQMEWLRMIRDHIASSFHLERDDLEYAPFDSHGGLGRMWQLFGPEMDALVDELNEVLAA